MVVDAVNRSLNGVNVDTADVGAPKEEVTKLCGQYIQKNIRAESSYWSNFYVNFNMAVPSQFCVMLATEANKETPVVEFGCGNGRDSIYLARHGFSVYASDLCEHAISHNKKKDGGVDNKKTAEFNVCDISKEDQVQELVQRARGDDSGTKLNLYNRFFLHSIDEEQERLFLTAVSKATVCGDQLYMEFRCTLNAKQDKIYTDHYRRYVNTAELVEMMTTELGFNVTYQCTGQGMAKYKNEDPFVSRIIAQRR